jgi:hypothetical protein
MLHTFTIVLLYHLHSYGNRKVIEERGVDNEDDNDDHAAEDDHLK